MEGHFQEKSSLTAKAIVIGEEDRGASSMYRSRIIEFYEFTEPNRGIRNKG